MHCQGLPVYGRTKKKYIARCVFLILVQLLSISFDISYPW